MKIIKHFFILGSLLTLNGCTSTTVIPQIGDLHTVISNASTENEAVKIATDRANRICTIENQKIKMIDLETVYQGNDPDQKALVKLAEHVLPKNKTSGPYTPENYTYKATLTFKCN